MKQSLLLSLLFTATIAFSQTAGDAFFSEWTVHEIHLHFEQPGYWDSLTVNYTLDEYMRCDVSVDGVSFPISGVKFKGNSSYNNQSTKKPFRIDFAEYDDNQEFDGLKKLVLNNAFKDPSFLREKLMLDFMNAHNIMAPRATFADLYINNQYWGLYTVVEDVNKTFLKERFDNKDGNLFKGDPHGTLTWKGMQQSLYETDYELKTNETENNWSDFIHFINILNNTSGAQLPDSLSRYLNMSSWFSYWAAQNLFVNLDSYAGSGHNYFLYHNTTTDQFEWIVWDVNEAFGNFQMGISLANIKVLPYSFIPQPANQRPMMSKVWAVPEFKQQYADRLCALLSDFSNAKMNGRIDSLANLIRPHVYADPLKFYNNDIFEQNLTQDVSVPSPGSTGIAGIKSFISERRASLLQQLSGVGCIATDVTASTAFNPVEIFPNPADEQVIITSKGEAIAAVRLVSSNGSVVYAPSVVDGEMVTLDVSKFPVGLYVLLVTTDQAIRRGRLVIMH